MFHFCPALFYKELQALSIAKMFREELMTS